MSDENILTWFETWSHQQLAKAMSVIWASKNPAGTKNLLEQIRKFEFELDTPKMMLGRVGEQQKISDLNGLFFEHPMMIPNGKQRL